MPLGIQSKYMEADIERKKKIKRTERYSKQVALGVSPFILPISFTIKLTRKRSFIPQPKSTQHFSIDFFCDWRLCSQTRTSLNIIYFVFTLSTTNWRLSLALAIYVYED